MPNRSRAITTRPVSRSLMTKANMPWKRSTQFAPQACHAFRITSVSPEEKKE